MKGAVLIAGAIVVAGAAIGGGLYLGLRDDDGAAETKDEVPAAEATSPFENTSAIEPLPLEPRSAAEELARRYGQSYCGDAFINGTTVTDGGQVFVPECLDMVENPMNAELAVLAGADGQVVILQYGEPTCYVNVRATTQEGLCR